MIVKRGKRMQSKWTPARIKELRDSYDESQSAFAARLRISVDTLQHWEQGRGPVPGLGEFALDRLEQDLRKKPVPA